MPRNPRCYNKFKYYHVMNQGNNKKFIFNHEGDIKHFIKLMNDFSPNYDMQIISYCIMSNHYHMLVQVDNINDLSKFIHIICTNYAIYYNKKNQCVGHVFRDRFKAQPILDEKHYNNCIKYIYNNPVKAGICNSPFEYKYSNVNEFFYNTNKLISNFNVDISCCFIDTDEDLVKCCDVVQSFLEQNQLKKEYLIGSKTELKRIAGLLKNEYNFSYREISNELNISKEKIRKILIE